MTWDDSTDFERELSASLERDAAPADPNLHDRAMAGVAATPQRSRRAAWSPIADSAWSRWAAIAGVGGLAMVIGVLIGSSRGGIAVGDDPTPTPHIRPSAPAWTEPSSYTFVFASECGERSLLGTFQVTVEDGIAVAYRPLDELALRSPGTIDDMPTLGTLIALVEEARTYRSQWPGRSLPQPSGVPEPSAREAIVLLETDPADGHPTFISIDWLPNAIDDEECYRITRYDTNPIENASPSPSAVHEWTEPDSYMYAFDSQCGLRALSGRWEVTVENGKVVDYHSPDHPGSPLPGIEMPTLADLMNQVERARADGDAIVKAFETDPADGHPTFISIDWLPNAIDDEECYVIESYTPRD